MKKHIIYLSILIASIIVAYFPFLVSPSGLKQTDSIAFGVYANAVVKHNILAYGQFGLWDNFMGNGQPLIGHLNALFYPINLLTLFFTNQIIAYKIVVLIHLIFAGTAMYFLLNFLRIKRQFSLLGAVFYIVNFPTENVVNLGLTNELINLYITPLLVLFTWKALFQKKYQFAVLSGVLLAFNVLAITLYVIYFNGVVLVALFLFYILQSSRKDFLKSIKNSAVVGLTILIVSLGLSAVKLIPTLQYSFLAMRQNLPLYGPGNPLSPSWDAQTISQTFYNVFYFLVPGGSVFFSKYLFVNSVFFVFLLSSFFIKSKKVYFFIFLTLISLWATLGNRYGVDIYSLFYYIFPGFKTIEHQNRFYIIANFTMPLLVGFGVDFLFGNIKSISLKKTLTPILIALSIVSCTVFVFVQLQKVYYRDEILAIKSQQFEDFNKDLGLLNRKDEIFRTEVLYNQYTNRLRQVFSYTAFLNNFKLTNQFLRDFSLSYEYAPLSPVVMTYDNGLVENKKIENLFAKSFIDKKYKLLSLLNTKYVLMDKLESDYPNKYITPVLSHTDGTLFQMRSYMPFIKPISTPVLFVGNNTFNDFDSFKTRYIVLNTNLDIGNYSFFTSTRKYLDDYSLNDLQNFKGLILSDPSIKNSKYTDDLLKQYLKSGGKIIYLNFKNNFYDDIRYRSLSIMTNKPANYLTTVQIDRLQRFLDSIKQEEMSKNFIVMKSITPEYFSFVIFSGNKTQALRIADTYYPGWNVYIDGKKSNIFMADGILKGIFIRSRGPHLVEFKFQPLDFYFGLGISFITSLFLVPLYLFLKKLRLEK